MKGEKRKMTNNYIKENNVNHSVNITGNASNVQIQQNVSNSTQIQITTEKMDYDKALSILMEILKYEPMFTDTYGDEREKVVKALNEAKKLVINKEEPSKIKGVLNVIKDISLRVSSSLIATGILGLLSQIKI